MFTRFYRRLQKDKQTLEIAIESKVHTVSHWSSVELSHPSAISSYSSKLSEVKCTYWQNPFWSSQQLSETHALLKRSLGRYMAPDRHRRMAQMSTSLRKRSHRLQVKHFCHCERFLHQRVHTSFHSWRAQTTHRYSRANSVSSNVKHIPALNVVHSQVSKVSIFPHFHPHIELRSIANVAPYHRPVAQTACRESATHQI